MATGDGMRPELEVSRASRQKAGRVATQRTTNSQVALRPAAAPTGTYVAAAAKTMDTKAEGLAKALSNLSPSLDSFAASAQKNTDDDIMAQAEYHMERIREEAGSGVVKSTQVGESLPEASHTVVARITQAMGKRQSKEFIQDGLEEIAGNDALRLDSASRKEYLAQLKAEGLAQAGDDPFFNSGFLEGLDNEIAKHEQQWEAETAKYHQEVQADEFSSQVVDTFINGGDLEALDDKWGDSSSLNPLERKELVVKALTQEAVAQRNEKVLDNVPTRFLNAQYKRDIQVTKLQIINAKNAEWSNQQARINAARIERTRGLKLQALDMMVDTGTVDLMTLRGDPDAYAYGVSLMEQPPVDKATSAVNATRFRSGILKAALTGDAEGSLADFDYNGALDEDTLMANILSNPMISQNDKKALIEDIPQLMEGAVLMQNDTVRSVISNVLTPALNDLANSTNAELKQLLEGTNLRARTMITFEDAVQGGFLAHYEETGKKPSLLEWRRIVNEARDDALSIIERTTKLTGAPSGNTRDRGGQMGRNNTPSEDKQRVKYGDLQ